MGETGEVPPRLRGQGPRRIRIALFVCSAFALGFILGDRSWKRLVLYSGPTVIVPNAPHDLTHFSLSQVPPYSSSHYYFMDGFTDVDEYLSFVLPPDRAKEFLATYVRRTGLPAIQDTTVIPNQVLGLPRLKEWDGRYWFSSLDELDQIYYKENLFVGYAASKNRFYLMNWGY